MNVFQFSIICKRTNNANNGTYYVKLGLERRESSQRNCFIFSSRLIIQAIIIILLVGGLSVGGGGSHLGVTGRPVGAGGEL